MTPIHDEKAILAAFRQDMLRTNYGATRDPSPPEARLQFATDELPRVERARQARELRIVFKRSLKEIAYELGCSVVTVHKLLKE